MTVRTVRAVFFDVNWTLVPHATKTIPTSTRQALATLPKRSARGRSDGQNDIEMRRGFGLGIAMGNACEEAKGAADYVTSDIDDEASRALSALGICPADFPRPLSPRGR